MIKKTNKYKDEIKGVAVILSIGVFLFLSYILFTETNKKADGTKQNIEEQYPFIQRKEKIGGVVFSNKETYLLNHTNLIILGNGKQFRLTKSGHNRNYNPSDLQDFIRSGDSICKPPYTDSLYIYRKNSQYYFILQNIIN